MKEIITVLFLFLFTSAAFAETYTVERVIDGDTIVVTTPEGKSEKVRLIGIDTPESRPNDKAKRDAKLNVLISRLKSQDREIRRKAMDELIETGEAAIAPLGDCLKEAKERGGSPQAAYVLGEIGSPTAVPLLIEALDMPGSIGWEAAQALGKIGDNRAIEPLLESMDIWGNSAVFVALGKFKDSRAVEPLVKELKNEIPGTRKAAATALGMLEDKRATDALADLLNDKYPEVRKEAVEALGKIGDVRAVEALINILKDETPGIRSRAIVSLGTLGDKRAVAPLIILLDDNGVSWYAAEALGVIGDPKAVEALLSHLEEAAKHAEMGKSGSSPGMVASAARALGNIGDKRATTYQTALVVIALAFVL